MFKKIPTLVFLLFALSNLFAEQPTVDQFVKNWRMIDLFGTVDSLQSDTLHLNYHELHPVDSYSIASSYNGNMGSPLQSKIYADRKESSDFMFANAYLPYMQTIQTTRFYTTKTPFSTLKYLTGGTNYRESDDVGFLFTANANKNLNFGTKIDYLYARGEYLKQSAKRFSGSLFGSYKGKKYSATGSLSVNSMSNFENGGISETSYITNPAYGYEKPENIPVRMSVDAQSTFKYFQFFYNHQYSLGFEREVKRLKDSVITEFVPVTRFIHTISIDEQSKRYYEKTLESKFYKNNYLANTNDTASLRRVSNRFAINLAEEFNKWMHFGLTAYLHNDIDRYTFMKNNSLRDSVLTNTKVGGMLSKEIGMKLTYRFGGELSLIGYKAGDVYLSGEIGTSFKLWKDTISLKAKAYTSTYEPDFYMKHYESSHFKWDNNFSKIFKTHIGGVFAIPSKGLMLDVSIENISKFVYFDSLAMPKQYDGSIQLLSAQLKKDFRFGKFGLDNTIIYQESLNDEVLPLPRLSLCHNLFFHDKWFKVLSLQVGATVRYHSSYYAPSYMPATGQFYNQREMKIGNYPVVSAYGSIHLKRTRFFVEYFHLNQKFMKGVYYSMPYYPINPAQLRMGLTWNFYD